MDTINDGSSHHHVGSSNSNIEDIDFIKPLEKREVVDNNTRKSTDSIRPRAKRLRKEIINQTNRRERPASSLDRERYQQTLGGGV
ncbi:hypothetical protein PPACK8108_LOCUS2659 [Phakopsora pachyrhizi]|uniref:Uncharacterized protein n=1 Tax=Phakopsora pachyrhizi TaxID=170000 RepID=A0AAV0AKM1_PHAPC|nr:hypothetical protein PPACK8108_LOCUS2659 [Phakopsora pachyrhizi]